MNGKDLVSIVFLFSLVCALNAQISFQESYVLGENGKASHIPLGIADMNGDYRDDIVRQIEGVGFNVDLQVTGMSSLDNHFIMNTSGGVAWTLGVADFNNDYQNDYMCSGFYNGAFFFTNTDYGTSFIETQSTTTDFYAQASNFVDVNNDGFIDLFVCNDDGLSKIYMNNGDGSFVDESEYINMITAVPSDNSGNYGSVWTDVDGDDDMDLYISKCRSFATSFDDPRRINTLFINDNGTYVEQAESFGLNDGAQSWSTDFADVDNDGDLDAYIGNHAFRHRLMENVDNLFFREVDNFAGDEILSNVYQSFFEDLDNDGFVDIIISGDDNFILHNKGNLQFERLDGLFGPANFISCTSGDINQDGVVDLLVSYFNGLESTAPDALFYGNDQGNNFITVALRGNQSNSNGVGAKLILYSDLGMQTRICKSGISYGITKSLNQRFGLGQDMLVDSLIIKWPSGEIDKYENLEVNKHMIANEGLCLAELQEVQYDDLDFCPGDPIALSVDTESTISWNNGMSQAEIQVDQEGIYAALIDDNNCISATNSVFVNSIEDELPQMNLDRDLELCFGDTLFVSTDYTGDLNWSNADSSEITSFTTSSEVWLSTENNCGMYTTDTFYVNFLNQHLDDYTEIIQDSIPVELFAEGNNVQWYADVDLNVLLNEGNTFLTDTIKEETIFYVINSEVRTPEQFEGGPSTDLIDLSNKYASEFVNGGLYFEVYNPMRIESVKVETERIGKRLIQVFQDDDLIAEREVEVNEIGISTLELNIDLSHPGDYFITTDVQFNIDNLGTTNCFFARLDGQIDFPFALGDLGAITNSEWGAIYYHHFFDWSVASIVEDCVSNIATYTIDTDFTSSLDDLSSADIQVFPNPTHLFLEIEGEEVIHQIEIYNQLGQLLFRKGLDSNSEKIDVSDLEVGIYLLKIHVNNQERTFSFSKI